MNAKQTAEKLKSYGRYGDTELVHMSKGEVDALRGIAQLAGGDLTRNPDTGQPEAFFLAALLPTIVGGIGGAMGMGAMGTAALGAGVGALTNRDNPLMGAITGGMGGFGGGQLAAGLTGLGASAGQQAAQQAVAGNVAEMMSPASGALGVDPGFVNHMRPDILQAATAQEAQRFAAQPFYTQAMEGGKALMQPGGFGQFVQGQGGMMPTMKNVGMAAAPLYSQMMTPKESSGGDDGKDRGDWKMREYNYDPGATGNYYGTDGDYGTYERQHFNPTFTRRFASGGLMQLTDGGQVQQEQAPAPTGASGTALNYLMGNTQQSPAAAQAQQMAAQQAAAQAQQMAAQQAAARAAAPAQSRAELWSSRMLSGFRRMRAARGNQTAATPRYSFDPQTQQLTRLASGGIVQLAAGGHVPMESGGFVVPADVTAYAGGGSTDAGQARLAKKLGAVPIKGAGDGLSDNIPASIDGQQPARVANGEMYLGADRVAALGGGDHKRGVRKLYRMLDNVRKQAVGHTKQVKRPNIDSALKA